MRLIDADELQKSSVWYLNDIGEECIKVEDIANAPTIEERKTGKWINKEFGQECSGCGEIQYGFDNRRQYCPFCGTKMEVEA